MAQCEIDEIKRLLRIPLEDRSKDLVLERSLNSASELVSGLLGAQGLAVPQNIPKIIVEATKYFAAWEFKRKSSPAKADKFWIEADKRLCVYTEQFSRGGISFSHQEKHKECLQRQ